MLLASHKRGKHGKQGGLGPRLLTVVLVVALVVGLGLMAYPTLSSWWNSQHQTRAIEAYSAAVEQSTDEENAEAIAEAKAYNAELLASGHGLGLSEEELTEYESLLNIDGTGVMGWVEIPSIDCSLPIYHGTDAAVLQTGVGHLEGSSLPVGGEGTHSVLSAHRGLPTAELFTDLDEVEVGDTFTVHVYGEELVYEVDQILIVLPEEVDALAIEEDKDLCTLVTCTPYGVNDHRLLVRGYRIDGVEIASSAGDAERIDYRLVALAIAVPIAVAIIAFGPAREALRARRRT